MQRTNMTEPHPPLRLVPTQREAARELGVTESTLCRWFSQGAPRRPDGVDVQSIHDWRAQQSDPRDGSDRAYWRQRRERADALAAEDRLAAARRHLIARTEHDDALMQLVDAFVSTLDNLPARCVPLLLGARGHEEMMRVLHDHCRHCRGARIQLAARFSSKESDNVSPTE